MCPPEHLNGALEVAKTANTDLKKWLFFVKLELGN